MKSNIKYEEDGLFIKGKKSISEFFPIVVSIIVAIFLTYSIVQVVFA